MKWKRAIIWFRNDLRLHDHEPLHTATVHAEQTVPLYCVDPRHFGKTEMGFPKTGSFRAQFLLESLQTLRDRLREKGSDLVIRLGKPEEVIPQLIAEYQADMVLAHKEITHEEIRVEERVEHALFKQGISIEFFWGSTLYHLSDLPMPVHALPDIFTQFRKQVEKYAQVRESFPTPSTLYSPAIPTPGDLPSLADLGLSPSPVDPRRAIHHVGGEVAALERLQDYFWEQDLLKEYKETRNGLLGAEYSSKFSAWLSLGCISPRKIFEEVKRYEKMRKKNASTYWLIFELIWRDYFRFVAKKYGNDLFFEGGIKQAPDQWHRDWDLFTKWQDGETGIPFVDANMRELKLTGFMSNRGRQNVASFLVKDLRLDWRMGAEWFESILVDYDVCSNYGNWNYVAGIGNDPRENRYFNVISQGKRYDGKGEFVKHWVPALENLPPQLIHEPHKAYNGELREYGVSLGGNYPHPIVALGKEAGSYAQKG